jgi:exo-1,4-beta-D-glucosaminidase
MIPRPELEKRYLEVVKEVHPSIIYISAAAERKSEIAGPTGIKMRGPYDYVTPNYWYIDSTKGGAFGFCSESGPGPQLPVLETVKKMVSPNDLWPMNNDQWKFHCGRRHFENMEIYNKALKERYGEPKGIEEYICKAQWMNYEAMKPTFESYRVNRKVATGLIHWMLNGSWPGTFWQLFDSYLIPNAAYYATKKACQPISVAYNYKDQKIYLLNDTDRSADSLQIEFSIYDSQSNLISSSAQVYSIDSYTSKEVGTIVPVKDINQLYFVFLKLKNKQGVLIADNYYWLSNQEDQFLNDTKKWFVTENSKFADFHYLTSLAKAKVVSSLKLQKNEKGEEYYEVQLENQSDKIAFNLELRLVDEKGELMVPVMWEDNYISLQPREKKIIMVKGYKSNNVVLKVNGINLN